MIPLGKATHFQFWSVFFVFCFTTTIAFLIGDLGRNARYDGWLAIVLGALFGTCLTAFLIGFARKRPQEYLGVYGKRIIGKYPHLVIMLLFSFFNLHLASYIIREFVDFFSQTYLRDTPNWAISLLFTFTLFTLVQTGCTGIFRFAQSFSVFVGLMFFVKPLFFLDTIDPHMLKAFLTLHDAKAVWDNTYRIIPWYGEIAMVAFFLPELEKPMQSIKWLWVAIGSGTYILISEYVLMLSYFGPELSGLLAYPALELARFISIGDFLQNLDPFIVSIWILSLFIKLSIILYTGILIFSQAFAISSPKLISLPLTALVAAYSLAAARNPVELAAFFNQSWATFACFIECLPAVYVIVDYVKRRRMKHAAAASGS